MVIATITHLEATMTTRSSTLLPDSRINGIVRWLTDGRVMGILFGLFMLAVGISIGAHFDAEQEWLGSAWWDSFAQNAGTEMLGAFLTYFLIETLVGRRRRLEEKSEATAEHKRRLIRLMGSQTNEEAVRAVEELSALDWPFDGSLQGADLYQANLERADLSMVYLREANLSYANLQQADLSFTTLQEADVRYANLRGATLRSVNLKEAKLSGANLQDAILDEAIFDTNTALPDGSKWTLDTDLTRFIDPNHPNFWRSDNPRSPAYRGDS
jgi:hypothetical protein